MAKISKLVAQMKDNPKNVGFSDLAKVCNYYFGDPRQKGTSHCVYKTPWEGDPRSIFRIKKEKRSPYQVKQVLIAIAKLEEINYD